MCGEGIKLQSRSNIFKIDVLVEGKSRACAKVISSLNSTPSNSQQKNRSTQTTSIETISNDGKGNNFVIFLLVSPSHPNIRAIAKKHLHNNSNHVNKRVTRLILVAVSLYKSRLLLSNSISWKPLTTSDLPRQ